MKNKELQKLLKKNKSQLNTGFTITELLVGVIMSTIVVGALGWGVMQVLNITQSQTSKSKIRSESSRAFSFISDELRRAQSIEVDTSNGNLSTIDNPLTPDINEEVAPSFSLPSGGKTILAMTIPNVSERVIYYTAKPNNDIWRGPLVIYRWGPALNADGSYSPASMTDPASWQAQALIDKIDDVEQTTTCNNESVTYKGFYACVTDDDGDGIVETADSNNDRFVLVANEDIDGDGTDELGDTAAIDVNGDATIDTEDLDMNQDGVVDSEDNADSDGLGISAQLFFTGETYAIGTEDDGNYAKEAQVVARARTAPGNNSASFTSYSMSYKTLGAVYGCNPTGTPPEWTMRTDFINDSSNPNSEEGNRNKKWVHDPDRQPQPIKIDTTNNLTINSIPIGDGIPDCISKGGKASGDSITYANEDLTQNGMESVYYNDGTNYTDGNGNVLPSGSDPIFKDNSALGDGSVIHRVSHTIDFEDPVTYNGYSDGNNDFYVGNGPASRVLFLRPGDIVPADPGYDPDDNMTTDNDQKSLREFLEVKGYMETGTNKVKNIDTNERIVIFEVGQTDTTHPGFDRQDNIFILSSDAFAKDAPAP